MFFFSIVISIMFLFAVSVALSGGSLVPVIFLYLIEGWVWNRYERKKVSIYRPLYINSNFRWLMIIVWPLIWIVRTLDNLRLRSDPERFTVSEGTSQNAMKFGSWSKAKAYAWEQAKVKQKDFYVVDKAKFRKMDYGNELKPAMYNVKPTGEVVRCFSIWR